MEENKSFDMDSFMEELLSKIEDTIEDILKDEVESAVTSALQAALEEASQNSLSRFEFELTDGTVVRPRQLPKIISPDKTKMLPLYGGVRVDGSSLIIQTSATGWERIASYQSKEGAVKVLEKIKEALKYDEQMRPGITSVIEL